MGGWSLCWQFRAQDGTPLWTGHPSITGPLTQTGDNVRHTRLSHVHISGMWKEAGVPRENPHRRGENVQTPHGQWSQPGIDFFFFSSSTL